MNTNRDTAHELLELWGSPCSLLEHSKQCNELVIALAKFQIEMLLRATRVSIVRGTQHISQGLLQKAEEDFKLAGIFEASANEIKAKLGAIPVVGDPGRKERPFGLFCEKCTLEYTGEQPIMACPVCPSSKDSAGVAQEPREGAESRAGEKPGTVKQQSSGEVKPLVAGSSPAPGSFHLLTYVAPSAEMLIHGNPLPELVAALERIARDNYATTISAHIKKSIIPAFTSFEHFQIAGKGTVYAVTLQSDYDADKLVDQKIEIDGKLFICKGVERAGITRTATAGDHIGLLVESPRVATVESADALRTRAGRVEEAGPIPPGYPKPTGCICGACDGPEMQTGEMAGGCAVYRVNHKPGCKSAEKSPDGKLKVMDAERLKLLRHGAEITGSRVVIDLLDHIEALTAERDRLRAAVDHECDEKTFVDPGRAVCNWCYSWDHGGGLVDGHGRGCIILRLKAELAPTPAADTKETT